MMQLKQIPVFLIFYNILEGFFFLKNLNWKQADFKAGVYNCTVKMKVIMGAASY